jgi:protocatechuate 3,4-dioxygenase alpha subunit
MSLQATPWQTVGPFFQIGWDGRYIAEIAGPGVAGMRVAIEGRLLDGDGQPVADGVIEIWQANAQGRYAHPEDARDLPLEPGFHGFGRVPTHGDGRFRFTTIKPGRVPAPGGALQAPHLVVSVLARGITRRLATRIYFPGEASNAEDPVLALVPGARRATLIARDLGSGVLEWNVKVQGADETVFFDV